MKKIILSREVLLLWLPTLAFWAVLVMFRQYFNPEILTYLFASLVLALKIYITHRAAKNIQLMKYLYFNEKYFELSKKDESSGAAAVIYFYILGVVDFCWLAYIYPGSSFISIPVSVVYVVLYFLYTKKIVRMFDKKFQDFEKFSVEITKKIVVADYPNEDSYENIHYIVRRNANNSTKNKAIKAIIEAKTPEWREEAELLIKGARKMDSDEVAKRKRDSYTRNLMAS